MPVGKAPCSLSLCSWELALALPAQGISPSFSATGGKNPFSSCRDHLAENNPSSFLGLLRKG